MKKYIIQGLITIFAVCISGCNLGEQKSIVEISPVEAVETSNENNKLTSDSESLSAFPEHYEADMEQVQFNMDICVDADLQKDKIVTAKARLQEIDVDKAFQLLYGNIADYESYEYEERNEYGETVKTGTYVDKEETTFSYGPLSSMFDYMERDLMFHILRSFRLEQGTPRYNAELFSKTDHLSFMTREDAFQMLSQTLNTIGVNIDINYTGYALDYHTLQTQEFYEDMEGNIDKSQYKPAWTLDDECYYFSIHQKYRELPLYHIYCDIDADVADDTAPIQGVVAPEGIEYLNIEKVFEIFDEKNDVQLVAMDQIVETVANKYNQILGDASYKFTNAELYYYVDLSSGMGTYEVRPIWILTGMEKTGQIDTGIQVIVDAQTAKEIIP